MVFARFRNVEQILSKVGPNRQSMRFGSHHVKLASLRLQCFKRSTVCAWCGRVGNMLVLESQGGQYTPHLNLYCETRGGSPILMTRDHILPLSRGGLNVLDNLQTMCQPCNCRKGNSLEVSHV